MRSRTRQLAQVLIVTIALAVLASGTGFAGRDQVGPSSKPWPEKPRRIDRDHFPRATPLPPLRNVAEFERMEGVLICYPLDIPYELIVEISESDHVFTLVADAAEEAEAAAAYANHGVHMENVSFIHALTDNIYTRDYGPWYVYDGNGDVAIVNHIYECYQTHPHDDMIPHVIGDHFGIPVYDLGLIHVGGNWQSDGHGTAIITRKVYDWNNDYSEAEIDSIMAVFMGIDRNICLPYFEPEGLHHVDCWAKLLTPETIVVKRVPEGDPNYNRIEQNVDFIASLETCFGRPYRIYRVDETGDENYTNSLILNGKVYVPQFESANDAPALAMFAEALPGYEINGFGEWWWQNFDALHCRTKEMADRQMLYVDHAPLPDTDLSTGGYRVDVLIHDHSNAELIADSLSVFWRREMGSGGFNELPLFAGFGVDSFYAEIPAQPLGTTISYYLRAADNSGRREYHPIVGALGPHSFDVKIDDEAPSIAHDPIVDISILAWPPTALALIKDNIAVSDAELEWSLNGVDQTALLMAKREGFFVYEAAFPGPVSEGDVIAYRIVASDGLNTSYDPPMGTHSFEIVPLQPLCVWNPDPTPSSGEIARQVLTDMSVEHEYRTDQDMPLLANYACVFIFLGIYENNRVLVLDEAQDLAAYLSSGGDVYMEGGDCWNFDPHCDLYLDLFGIDHSEDGTDDLASVIGIPGTLADGMSFAYSGENAWMDEIWPSPDAEAFFYNPSDDNGHAITSQIGGRRSIAAAFEFGGLDDGDWPATKAELMRRYAEFFDLTTLTAAPGADDMTPVRTALLPNHPNPFNPRTAIRFSLAGSGRARLSIYDLRGRLVRRLVDGPRPAGYHTEIWDGRDDARRELSSGVYFIRLETEDLHSSRKLVLIH